MTKIMKMPGAFQILLGIAVVLPACDGFVCSQERIKAMELSNRGTEEFKNNLYDSAEKDFKQAIQTDPSYEIAYYNLGKIFQKQRKWDKAIEYFEQAAQRKPDNGNYQYDLGEAYFESKKLDQAREGVPGGDQRRRRSCSRPGGVWAWSTRSSTARRRRTMRSATPSRPTRASRSRTSCSATSTSTTTSTRKRLRCSRAA